MPPSPYPMDPDQILAVLQRISPPDYWQPLLGGNGKAFFIAIAAALSRASQAVANADTEDFILDADEGTPSTGNLTLVTGINASPIPIPVGSRFIYTALFGTTPNIVPVQVAFVTTAPATIPSSVVAGNVTIIPVTSVRVGFQSALVAGLPLAWDPVTTSANIVAVTTSITSQLIRGGTPNALDLLGAMRGVFRQSGESVSAYRHRIRRLPDVVTPQAMLNLANRVISQFGLSAQLQEALGMGNLPPNPSYSGIIVGFLDADPPPPIPPVWVAGKPTLTNAIVRPTAVGGYTFTCTTPGTTGGGEPAWPTTVGATVVDGGVTWTLQARAVEGLWYLDQGLQNGLVTQPVTGTPLGYAVGPSDESNQTSRDYFRLIIPYVKNVNPGIGFVFTDLYPNPGTYFPLQPPPAGDYPYPPSGFLDQGTYLGDGALTPTGIAAAQIYTSVLAGKAGGVGFEIVVKG